MTTRIFVELNDQRINIDHITSISYANGTTVFLSDGRRITVPTLSAGDVLERIQSSIERAQS